MFESVFYLIMATGTVIFFSHEIYMTYCGLKSRYFIRRNLKILALPEKHRRYGKLEMHLCKVIEGADLMDFYKSAGQFSAICMTVFALSVCVLASFFNITLTVLVSAFLGLVPYLICLIRLSGKRSSGSREGDILVYEILNSYRIQNYNMKSAIELCAISIEGAPVSKYVLINLSKELNLVSSEEEINSALENFRYAFDTAWGNILASNMFLAIYRGVNVEQSLEVLSESISKGRQAIEYERRENYESSLILRILVPVCYGFSVMASTVFFDIKLSDFIYYQFCTSIGLKWFIIMSFIYFISYSIAKIASNEKMDI